jgi:hypothetical protein
MPAPSRTKTEGRKIFKLRNVQTGKYLSVVRMTDGAKMPVFNEGKEFESMNAIEDMIVQYELYSEGKWPALKLEMFEVIRTPSLDIPDLSSVIKFIRRTRMPHYSSIARLATRAASAGIPFRYLVWADGFQDVDAIHPVMVQRNRSAQRWDRFDGSVRSLGKKRRDAFGPRYRC